MYIGTKHQLYPGPWSASSSTHTTSGKQCNTSRCRLVLVVCCCAAVPPNKQRGREHLVSRLMPTAAKIIPQGVSTPNPQRLPFSILQKRGQNGICYIAKAGGSSRLYATLLVLLHTPTMLQRSQSASSADSPAIFPSVPTPWAAPRWFP